MRDAEDEIKRIRERMEKSIISEISHDLSREEPGQQAPIVKDFHELLSLQSKTRQIEFEGDAKPENAQMQESLNFSFSPKN